MTRPKLRPILRTLFALAAWASLALCAAAVAVQAAGGWDDSSGRFHPLFGSWEFGLSGRTDFGVQVVILHGGDRGHEVVGPVIPPGPSPQLDAFMARYPPAARWHGKLFGFEYGPSVGSRTTPQGNVLVMGGTRTWVQLPYATLELLLLVLPAIRFGLPPLLRRLRAARESRRSRVNACTTCGYDLTGNTSGVCPECGTAMRET